MEKIKSVLSGHKKSEDATHDAHTSSTGTHHEGETHPIYDQMKGSSSGQPATTGTAMSAGQTGTSTGLGHTEHQGTEGTLGGHSALAGHSVRPGAPGAGNMHEGISEASIKSGVIGFGTGERQEHAALSSRQNPEVNLDRNQVVGGGSMAPDATIAETSKQPSVLPVPGTSTSDQSHGGIGNTGMIGSTTHGSTERQPYEQTLRQESYTTDTDRSFPLSGGVASKHDSSLSHPTEHHSSGHHTSSTFPPVHQSSSTTHPITSERELGTKERDIGAKDGHGREGLAGAAAAAAAIGVASHQRDTHDQGLSTRDTVYGNQPTTTSSTIPSSSTTQGHNPEALAAATAAAAQSSSMAPPTHSASSSATTSGVPVAATADTQSHNSRYNDPGRPPGGRSISYRHVPGGFPTPTPDDSKTFLFYRDEVVPEPGVEAPVAHHVPSTRGTPYGQHQLESRAPPVTAGTALAGGLAGSQAAHHSDTVGSGTSTAGPHQSDILNKADPRIDSDLDGSRTTTTGSTTNAPFVGGDSSTVPTGQHELRHTGSLEQPKPHSDEYIDEHHHGRDAAIAGGVGAGAAGIGYAATHKRDTPEFASVDMPQESSPYSSKQLDPRVSGSKGVVDTKPHGATTTQQGLQSSAPIAAASTREAHGDPAALEKSSTGPHKSSLLNKLDPRVKNDKESTTDSTYTSTTKEKDAKDHHGRDAALVGGGVAAGVGAHHALQRNDTPGTGTAVLPVDDSSTKSTGPLSSTTTAPHHTSTTAAPLSGTTSSLSGQTTNTSVPRGSSEFSDFSQHPAATKKYEPYQGPATTSGTPFYGAVGAPAPLEASSDTHQPTSASTTTAPLSGHHDSHASSTIPATQHQDSQHHYGRDATLVGAGAATAGGLAYAGQHENKTDTGPASKTIGPHSSNIANVVDPRVKPDPSIQGSHTTTTTTTTTTAPHQSGASHQGQHHLGRDAALVGGTGAAGLGAHEAANAYGDHRSTQPSASMEDQRYDPTASSTHASHSVPVTVHEDHTGRNAALGSGAVLGAGALGGAAYAGARHGDNTQHVPASSAHPSTAIESQRYDPTASSTHASHPVPVAGHEDHTGRNVALGSGAVLGAGALGGAAFAGTRHGDNTQQVPASSTQPFSSSNHAAPLTQAYPTQGSAASAYPTSGAVAPQNTHSTVAGTHAPHDSVHDAHGKDNTKRDAALLGTAGAATAGGAAYAHNQHSGLSEKEQHKLEKEEHKHEKEQEKEAHRLEKEREKEAHRLEKEREKNTSTPEKKHGILGFLHRDKSKKEKTSADTSPRHSGDLRRSSDTRRHSKEYAAGGAALGAGTTAAAYGDDDSNNPNSPRWKGKNRLHKDPPKGHPARESLEHHEMGEMSGGAGTYGAGTHSNATHGAGTYGSGALGAGALGAGTYAAGTHGTGVHGAETHNTATHGAGTYGSGAIGAGTLGAGALGAGKREHIGTDGPIGDANAISGVHQTKHNTYGAEPIPQALELDHNRVIEPHTGLPMNVGRFGDGHGGTDANPTVHGHHEHGVGSVTREPGMGGVHGTGATGATGSTTNWEAIKKADTPY